MSLPAREEQILGRMAHSLHASEPHLTSMFAIFTRLARDEDMPRVEAFDAWSSPCWGWRQPLKRPRGKGRTASAAGAVWSPGASLRVIVLVPIMLAALAAAVFFYLGGHTASGCGPAARPRHTAPAPSRPRACVSVPPRAAYQRLPG